jgi:hypothetical protein
MRGISKYAQGNCYKFNNCLTNYFLLICLLTF